MHHPKVDISAEVSNNLRNTVVVMLLILTISGSYLIVVIPTRTSDSGINSFGDENGFKPIN